jgi:hypothetical protein
VKLASVAAAGLVAGVAVAVWFAVRDAPRAGRADDPAVRTTTAKITRGDVVGRVTLSGTIGYDGSYPVANQLPAGVVTAVPDPGAVVRRGGRLFAVAGAPVALLYGATPAYRQFAVGMSDGPDVLELEQNLVALGMDPDQVMGVDDHFTSYTAAVTRRWQEARGLPFTGKLPLGQVVFLPGPVRVSEVAAQPGALVAPGAAVLSATSTSPAVTAQVGTDQQQLVHPGEQVSVDLPTGQRVSGRVARIGQVAPPPTDATSAPAGPPTIPVTVRLTLPPGSGALDQAPVQVQVIVEQHRNVLMVPVTALLAATGGYQVRVVEPGATRLVAVEPGLYDDTAATVEVSGTGLSEGMSVEVPVP